MRARAFTDVALGDADDTLSEQAGSRWTVSGLIGLMGIGLAAWLSYGQKTATNIHTDDYVARTDMILRTTPLIDGHNDLPLLLRLELHNQIYDNKTFPFRNSGWSKLYPG